MASQPGSVAACQQRAPATPLITHDPYFSIWSETDLLTDSETTHWTGNPQQLTGVAQIDGKPFRFMGTYPEQVPAMKETASSIKPTHTNYEFTQSGVTLALSFYTPAMMNSPDILSRPVTYLTCSARATDEASHKLSVLLDVDPQIAVNDSRHERRPGFQARSVVGGVFIKALADKEGAAKWRAVSMRGIDFQSNLPVGIQHFFFLLLPDRDNNKA